jgi:hypothetical protein
MRAWHQLPFISLQIPSLSECYWCPWLRAVLKTWQGWCFCNRDSRFYRNEPSTDDWPWSEASHWNRQDKGKTYVRNSKDFKGFQAYSNAHWVSQATNWRRWTQFQTALHLRFKLWKWKFRHGDLSRSSGIRPLHARWFKYKRPPSVVFLQN